MLHPSYYFYLSVPVVETILYLLHRLAEYEDAPFQIDPLGVQAKQIHCPEPPVDGRTLWLPDPDRRASSILSSHIDY